MSAKNESSESAQTPAVPWRTRIGYVGTGVVIGLVIYPFVRKAISKIQPKLDSALDRLTGHAEDLAEKATDILARAKESVFRDEANGQGHSHPHPESHA